MGANRSIAIAFQNASTSDVFVRAFSPPDGWASGQAPEQAQRIAAHSQFTWIYNLPNHQNVQGTLELPIFLGGLLSIFWEWKLGDTPTGGATVEGSTVECICSMSNLGLPAVTLNVTLSSPS